MVTLAHKFMEDLEEGDVPMPVSDGEDKMETDENDGEIAEESEYANKDNPSAGLSLLKYNDVKMIAKLRSSERLERLMNRIEKEKNQVTRVVSGPVEEDPEYQLVVECNIILMEIANEITKIHKFIRDHYASKFRELESLVLNPLDYARVVKRIGNETDLTLVDLSDILPAATIMVVTVTASTASKQLEAEEMKKVLEACDEALALDEIKQKLLAFVESRMSFIAPNLSTIVGSSIAAQLIGVAGGLGNLSRLPSCNVQVLGSKKKTLSGFSSASTVKHTGFIHDCEIIQKTPPPLRGKACRLIAGKCTLAARVDSYCDSPDGEQGSQLREEILKKIEKWQEPPPAKLPKPLPAPDDKPRKRRGGKRYRKMKEKYAVTDLRKHANRMAFGVAEETYRESGKGFGMIGKSGKVRLIVNDKGGLAKTLSKRKHGKNLTTSAPSGLSSSLAFTPAQGLELGNPQAAAAKIADANKRYFGNTTFLKLAN